MAAEIGPGSLVVCVEKLPEDDFVRTCPGVQLTPGSIYKVECIQKGWGHQNCPCGKDAGIGYRLVERPGPFETEFGTAEWLAYAPCLFRPLNDGDTSLVEGEKELEEAITRIEYLPVKERV